MIAGWTMARAIGLLGKVPFWVWPMVVILLWGWYGNHAYHALQQSVIKDKQAQAAAIVIEQTKAKAKEDDWKEKFDAQRKTFEGNIAGINAAHSADLARVRDRASRRANVSSDPASACSGASGSELSRPDAEFLIGYAAEAARVQAALKKCQGDRAVLK